MIIPEKKLVLVSKIGPAFTPGEVAAAHTALDDAGVPRVANKKLMSLAARINWLAGLLKSAETVITEWREAE